MANEIENLQLETEDEERRKGGLPTVGFQVNQLKSKLKFGLLGLLIIAAGVYSGFLLSEKKGKTEVTDESGLPKIIIGKEIVGSTDTESFRDQAVGVLEKNENGPYTEGTHRLIREGGPSQTAYLISSIVDLDQFVGREVEVWGETFHSDKVGWLMDVGRLKVLK